MLQHIFLPPANEVDRQVSVCPQAGVSVSCRGVSVPGDSVRETPPGQRPPWTVTPPDRDNPLDRDPRTETPLDRDPCTGTPGQRPPGQRPPSPEQRPPSPEQRPPSPGQRPPFPGQRPPCTVTGGRYVSHWNAFLL